MNDTFFQLTLRRWATVLTSGRFYAILATFIMAGAVIGPFGIINDMPFTERLGISLLINCTCWSIGVLVAIPSRIALELHGYSRSVATIFACIGTNFILLPVVLMLSHLLMGSVPALTRILEQFTLIAMISTVLAFGFLSQIKRRDSGQETLAEKQLMNEEPCLLLERLPMEKRGVVFGLQAQDHYVKVITSKGSHMVLMRLSDAIDMCNDAYSTRVHRSAWVTKSGISSVEKQGRNWSAILHSGDILPVSRNHQKDIRRLVEMTNPSSGFSIVETA